MPGTATWDSFHGQLNAQKYSPLTQITADNVGKLTKVWEFHTGDVSDGKGDTPATVWSATPIFANDTLYIGTPFDRLIALDRGRVKRSGTMTQIVAQGADPAGAEKPRRFLLAGQKSGDG